MALETEPRVMVATHWGGSCLELRDNGWDGKAGDSEGWDMAWCMHIPAWLMMGLCRREAWAGLSGACTCNESQALSTRYCYRRVHLR